MRAAVRFLTAGALLVAFVPASRQSSECESLPVSTVGSPDNAAARHAAIVEHLSLMPLLFTENRGQWDGQVLFRANAGGATMWITRDGVFSGGICWRTRTYANHGWNAYDANHNGGTYPSYSDVFVTKLSAGGNALEYSTYLGGLGNEHGRGIAVDSSGCAYVMGQSIRMMWCPLSTTSTRALTGARRFRVAPWPEGRTPTATGTVMGWSIRRMLCAM